MRVQHPELTGIGFVLAAFFAFSLNDAVRRMLATRYPIEQVLAWGSVFALALLLVVAQRYGFRATLMTRQPRLQALRAVLVAGAAWLAVYAFAHAEMVSVYTMIFTAPVITALLAPVLLGERLTSVRLLTVVAGFVGSLFVLQPQQLSAAPGLLAALVLAGVFSVANLLVRRLRADEGSVGMAIYPLGLLVLGFGLGGQWLSLPPAMSDLGWFVLSAMLQAFGLIAIIVGFRRVKASVAAPFQYSQLLWGLGLGYFLFDEVPTGTTWLGAGIIVGAGLGLWWFETGPRARIGKERRS